MTLRHLSAHSSCAAALVKADAVPALCSLLKAGPQLRTRQWPGGEHVSETLLGIAGHSSLVAAVCHELGVETTTAAVEVIRELAGTERNVKVLFAW